ncbi:DUF6946 family protein [Albimonas pacifica]|uniref:DUF6946 domain-containing protein n=1 Tax=Albimonas pacifica TaxID=1114924 RepID=A0A1I3N0V8_9RHOB|nr:hypothetical protein [Albimonas pacifica]SFJ02822.1 hypothetical protein SAMN05216258_11278 [Albimonas pacifica]
MTRIFITRDGARRPSQGPECWKALLANPKTQWRPGFSAMAAARSWEAAQSAPSGLPPEVAALLGPEARLATAEPEFKVPLPGRGGASQCDVFAMIDIGPRRIATAVEAKVEESFGPTLAAWTPDRSPGRGARLAAILALLGAAAPPLALRYQLLHRSAAAILEAQRRGADAAAMLVQSFSPRHRRLEDFEAFCAWLGLPDPAPGRLMAHSLPCGRDLLLGWVSSGASTFLEPAPGREG